MRSVGPGYLDDYACIISSQHTQSSQWHCHWKITWIVTHSKRGNFTDDSSSTSMHLIKEGCYLYIPRAMWNNAARSAAEYVQEFESALKWSRHVLQNQHKRRNTENSFKSEDLADMQNVHFPLLRDVDIQNLEEITVIAASRQNTGRTDKRATVCTCKGKCVNNKCKCKRTGVPRSTKCHPVIAGPCQNKPQRTRGLYFLLFICTLL